MQTAELKEAGIGTSRTTGGVAGAREIEFERRFAECTRAPHALAFTFARNALATTLRAAGLGADDEILLSPLTCKVVPLAILAAGLKPVYTDIVEDTLYLDAALLGGSTSSRTRALLFQRTYGSAAGARPALDFARARGLFGIEDCAQCMPSPDAWAADAAIFSNNPGKPLPAGSGGVVVLRDAELAGRVAAMRSALPRVGAAVAFRTRLEAWLRNRVISPSLYWPAFELNRRFDSSYATRSREVEIADEVDSVAARIGESQAAAGLLWLARAAHLALHREAICGLWAGSLSGMAGLTLPYPAGDEPLYFFPVLVDAKDALLREAKRRRVEIIAWPVRAPIYPVTEPDALGTYGYTAGCCPVAEDVAQRVIGLPTHGLVKPHDIERTVALLEAHSRAGSANGATA